MNDEAKKVTCACPLNGQLCVDGVRSDFPDGPIHGVKVKCRWWTHVVGKDPQTTKDFDFFDCAVAWLPVTTLENSQMSRQTSAAVDKVANEVGGLKTNIDNLGRAVAVAGQNIRQGIEAGTIQVLVPTKEKDLLEGGKS